MILGEIDLSIGAMYLFTPFIWHVIHHAGIPLYPSIVLALVVAMLLGAANGFAVAFVGISSFVATLGMLFVLDGVTLVISHATPVNTPGTSVVGITTFAQIFGGGTYSELLWAIGIVIVLQLLLSLSRWGIYTVAVGGNRLGAAEAGISVRGVLIRNFVMCAGLAGFVGILEAVRTTTATPDPSGSNDILFQAISAAVIGGTLLRGGSGTVVGALIGALFLGILHDGLIIKGVNANYLDLYLGIAILFAMGINTYVSRVRTGSGRG
jgi:simple sugar transport system permease protein